MKCPTVVFFTSSGTRISAKVDLVQMEDGTEIQPLSVIFPEGNTIHAQDRNQVPFYHEANESCS